MLILPELAQELRTHFGTRTTGYLFETNRHLAYSPWRVQQIVKETAERAKIKDASARISSAIPWPLHG